MKRLIATLCIIICLISVNVFAIEDGRIIRQADFYTGTLFYCDAERGMVVLQDVQPVGEKTESRKKVCNNATYNEIPIYGSVTMLDGSVIPFEYCNLYADSQVRVLIIRDVTDRLQVVNMKFL